MIYFLWSLLVALLSCHGITQLAASFQLARVSPCRQESLSLYAFRWKSLWWDVKLVKNCLWSVCSSNMRSRSALLFPLHLCAVETGDTACHLSLSTSLLLSVPFCMYLWVFFIVTVLKYSANFHSLFKDRYQHSNFFCDVASVQCLRVFSVCVLIIWLGQLSLKC